MFSIIIPTWNNLPYIKLCVESILKNSALPHQVILHINDGSDGTLEWAQQQQIAYTHTPYNAGICIAVNTAASLAMHDYFVYMNDDMYCCPGWDTALINAIKELPDDNFMLSGTMIEPVKSNNTAVITADFGRSIETFDEAGLLQALPNLDKPDWSGSSWPPVVLSKKYWHIIGGFSIEFSPGMASDDDLAMKMWAAGCRIFKGIGKSMIYHFQTKSTTRIKKNDGRKQFVLKWGTNPSTFNKLYIHKGEPYNGTAVQPADTLLRKDRLKVWFKKKFVY